MPPDIFDLLDQWHFEEVLYLAGAPITVALVKSHRSLQGLGCIQSDSPAIPFDQFIFRVLKQTVGSAASLPRGLHSHASQVAFRLAHHATSNRAHHTAVAIGGHKDRLL